MRRGKRSANTCSCRRLPAYLPRWVRGSETRAQSCIGVHTLLVDDGNPARKDQWSARCRAALIRWGEAFVLLNGYQTR